MDSLFQKMLAESNTEIETNVDIVSVSYTHLTLPTT